MANENPATMEAKMSDQSQSTAQRNAIGLINEIDSGIEEEMSGRIQHVLEMLEPVLTPSPTAAVQGPDSAQEVRSDIINRLKATNGKVAIMIKILDHLVSRIDV